ncbi:MAG: J domain-containing protein [Actinomycetota bacterium]|nr:J domain-containing protein [Actinomycetota bacterium]MDH5223156.1 J domain-containing protein [Actinomycetota bacterium]MDH5312208.1 J domain-containing protein [Actinomycetota bacterium]
MDAVARAVTSGEDLYALLGVPADASDDDIRRAYRTLARRHHPDANPGEVEGAGGFRRVAAAYEILGDERVRGAYDRALGLERRALERAEAPGPVASHAAPRPTGAVGSRGPSASTNPADHAPRVQPDAPPRRREPPDEWRVVSVFGRIVAAAAAIVVIAVVVLMMVSANAGESDPAPGPTIWCKTPDGWYDCWRATTPDGL